MSSILLRGTFCVALTFVFGAFPVSKPTVSAADVTRVMSFNIRYDNPRDGENAWPHRRDWVAELIQESKVDVVGLQEALKSQVDDLDKRLTSFRWYGVGRDDGAEAGEFAPIFFNNDHYELVDQGHFWLCEKPDEAGRKGWDASHTRIATWVALRRRATASEPHKAKQYFFNTHFDHRGVEAREKSALLLRKRIAAIDDGPVVLTGDLNCLSGSQPIRNLTGDDENGIRSPLTDAFVRAKEIHQGPLGTWNGFKAIRAERRIDFAFVSSHWTVVAHQIIDQQRDGRFPSDHLPVLATLKMKEASSKEEASFKTEENEQ